MAEIAEMTEAKAEGQDLQECEAKLSDFFKHEMSTWIATYHILRHVQDGRLYEPDAKSFSAWVKAFCSRESVHESYLWRIMKAGRVLDENVDGGSEAVEGQRISAEAVCLAEKAGRDSGNVSELLDKAISGELQRKDLQEAWTAKKREQAEAETEAEGEQDRQGEQDESAAIIKKSLSNRTWFVFHYSFHHHCKSGNDEWPKHREKFYQTFDEFSIDNPMTRQPMRIDTLIVENLTNNGLPRKIIMHGVEIKVSKSDLENDRKMSEYVNYVDYFWVAVPDNPEMIETAESVLDGSYGILTCSPSRAMAVKREARRIERPKFRYLAIESLAVKLLPKLKSW